MKFKFECPQIELYCGAAMIVFTLSMPAPALHRES